MQFLAMAALLIAGAAMALCVRLYRRVASLTEDLSTLRRTFIQANTQAPVKKTQELYPGLYTHGRLTAHPVVPSPLVRSSLRQHL